MPASPSTVLTQGIGAWGSVNLLPTIGFGSSTTVIVDGPFCFEEGIAYAPGGEEGLGYAPGGEEGVDHVPGGEEGIAACNS